MSDSLEQIHERLLSLEQPYRHLSEAVAAGVLKALKDANLDLAVGTPVPPKETESISADEIKHVLASTPETPGVFPYLGSLPPGALISEQGLAALLKKHPVSIKHAVEGGELPEPVRFMGKGTWTAGAVLRHMESRLEETRRYHERITRRHQPHAP